MNILILGGTVFLGRALVDAAQARGHTVTLFNRGKSNPELYPGLEQIQGDREGGLEALGSRTWDAVIDTSGYVPRLVRQSAERLADSTGHYTFISSISVYASNSQPGQDESSPVGVLADPTVEEVTGETYGPLKALCEQAVQETLPGRDLILRPGLIVGPHDPSDRFSYWPHRVAQGGEVLAPGRPGRLVQFMDVRDLAGWNIRLVEQNQTGVYNANGPDNPTSMEDVLEACRVVSRSDARFTWVSENFLIEHSVGPWIEMPLWVPESDPEFAGFFAYDLTRSFQAGLTTRPLKDTVEATLAWLKTRPADHTWRAGLTPEKEADLLQAWHIL